MRSWKYSFIIIYQFTDSWHSSLIAWINYWLNDSLPYAFTHSFMDSFIHSFIRPQFNCWAVTFHKPLAWGFRLFRCCFSTAQIVQFSFDRPLSPYSLVASMVLLVSVNTEQASSLGSARVPLCVVSLDHCSRSESLLVMHRSISYHLMITLLKSTDLCIKRPLTALMGLTLDLVEIKIFWRRNGIQKIQFDCFQPGGGRGAPCNELYGDGPPAKRVSFWAPDQV